MSDENAPHGYDDQGLPLAPYGYKVDGTPRKSRRGAQAGSKGNTAKTATAKKGNAVPQSPTDLQRKSMFCDLTSNLIEVPLIGLSVAPPVVTKIGANHANALAGDAYLIHQFAPHIFDGLNMLSQTKPKVLSWMDKAQENAPLLHLALVGIQMTKAVVSNHMTPNPQLANAGRMMMQMQFAEMAQATEDAARAAGINVDAMTRATGAVPQEPSEENGWNEYAYAEAETAAA